jgi:hypothetical protein
MPYSQRFHPSFYAIHTLHNLDPCFYHLHKQWLMLHFHMPRSSLRFRSQCRDHEILQGKSARYHGYYHSAFWMSMTHLHMPYSSYHSIHTLDKSHRYSMMLHFHMPPSILT